jgi:arginine repressor
MITFKEFMSLDETKKLTTQQKFTRALKRHGYDVDASQKYWSDKMKEIEAQKKEYEKQGIIKPS